MFAYGFSCSPRWQRLVAVAGMSVVCTLLLIIFHPRIGDGIVVVVMVPVTLSAWLFGLRGGFLAGVLAFPLTALVLVLVGDPRSDVIFREAGWPASIASACLGTVIGWLRDLTVRLSHELNERGKGQAALRDSEER